MTTLTTQAITVDGPEFASAPRTIRALIVETIDIGGEVFVPVDRRFEFHLPCRFIGGTTRLVNRVAVGYYVENGKNVIRGVQETRREIAYWKKQAHR